MFRSAGMTSTEFRGRRPGLCYCPSFRRLRRGDGCAHRRAVSHASYSCKVNRLAYGIEIDVRRHIATQCDMEAFAFRRAQITSALNVGVRKYLAFYV